MSGEAPDIREQEDCPSAEVCDGLCDQHEARTHRGDPMTEDTTRPQPTPSAEVQALARVIDPAAFETREIKSVRIAATRAVQIAVRQHIATEHAERVLASDWLAAYVQAARDEERARVLDEVQRVFDMQCPPMASENYIAGAWAAHSWWNTVLGSTLRNLRGGAR